MTDEQFLDLIREYKKQGLIKKDIPNDLIMDITYSPYYTHGDWNYRIVSVPKKLLKFIPSKTLLSTKQWQAAGIIMSQDWEHWQLFEPEPQSLMFRKYVGSDKSGKKPIPDPQTLKPVVPTIPPKETQPDNDQVQEQTKSQHAKDSKNHQDNSDESSDDIPLNNKRKSTKSQPAKRIKVVDQPLEPNVKSENEHQEDNETSKPRRSTRISK